MISFEALIKSFRNYKFFQIFNNIKKIKIYIVLFINYSFKKILIIDQFRTCM